ncbi:MAG: hypothetical protein WCX61_03565, partial [Candidatus Peribacteraceae bacterium]
KEVGKTGHEKEAKWRYRNGLKTVQRSDPRGPACDSSMGEGDDTETQYMRTRWCGADHLVEEKLQEVLTFIETKALARMDPPLQHGEVVLFPPLGEVWVRVAKDPYRSDVGFKLSPLPEPIFDSLSCSEDGKSPPACVDGVILAGMYPKDAPIEPPAGEELCALPFGSKGYLCRPINTEECTLAEQAENVETGSGSTTSPSQNEEEEASDEIVLTGCTPTNYKFPISQVESGTDPCTTGGWRLDTPTIGGKTVKDTPGWDKETITHAYECGNCAVDVFCEGSGPKFTDVYGDRASSLFTDEQMKKMGGKLTCGDGMARTFPKTKKGIIPVCLPSEHSANAYLLMHELIHAQQACNLPPYTILFNPSGLETNNDLEGCCSKEWPTYMAQCNAIAEDGNFEGAGIDLEMCTSVLANSSCKHLGSEVEIEDPETHEKKKVLHACSIIEDQEKLNELNDLIIKLQRQNKANLPTSCSAVIAQADLRITSIINSLPLACSPDCQVEYPNTIANQACYLAQCVEQSLETQRLIPGRMTYVSADESFPWESWAEEDPLIGSILPIPPLPVSRLPAYRPAFLARKLDLALCQTNGFPILNPPQECNFDSARQLSLRPADIAFVGLGLLGQTSQQRQGTWNLQTMGPGIGARIGTTLYREYFQRGAKAFKDLVDTANHLIGKISSIEFPTESCPRIDK